VYTFKNIRFAAPPTGQQRWAKPAPPGKYETIQSGDYGPTCMQSPVKNAANSTDLGIFGLIFSLGIPDSPNQSEGEVEMQNHETCAHYFIDCLFLDMYVSGKVLNGKEKVPVVHWLHPGALVHLHYTCRTGILTI
jgi:carboxylesterase type B